MGDVSITTDLTLLMSRWRHASALVLMKLRNDLFVADSDKRADTGRYGAVCRKTKSMEMRSSKEVGILNDYEAGMEWQRVRNMSFSRLEMIRYWGPRTPLFDASDILVRNLESGRLEASLPLVHVR
jgi:hypothetical protein